MPVERRVKLLYTDDSRKRKQFWLNGMSSTSTSLLLLVTTTGPKAAAETPLNGFCERAKHKMNAFATAWLPVGPT